ncbi:ferredoxin family protein [Trueperella bialowiezensis]|uniref:Ferredoxin-like protein n=1 Tax=Trueperella bialowiezensis TaxID=312285 RepID=A0A448PCQ7_9ACTO|nr:4Fe-4S dicluster domain-containing protein [Trueperella bialowiezensis]VEI12677.1 ferredoxin-like protein FixX [Trueperella bialowiezensis]
MSFNLGSVNERLSKNVFHTDSQPHISIDQERARATGSGKRLVAVCPAHVYSENDDGTIAIETAACLECGTCLVVADPGVLTWHYPAGAMGVQFREG